MSHDDRLLLVVGACVVVVLLLYPVPTLVAFARGHPNRWAIGVVNLVFGGTGIGWLGALVWACHAVHRGEGPDVSHGGASGLNLFVHDITPHQAPGRSGAMNAMRHEGDVDWAVAQLDRIGRLREQGALSAAEYATLKGSILGRIGVKPG